MKRKISIAILNAALLVPAFASADDARLQQALQLFQNEQFTEAAAIFEELNEANPSNALRLNAMVAWYKGGQCREAMASWRSVDRDQPLESRDHRDLDTVEAYCQLQTAKAEADAGQRERALATLDSISASHTPWQDEILALRGELTAEPVRDVREPAEPSQLDPPEAPPAAEKAKWPLWTGIGVATTGAVVGIAGLVKTAADQRTIDEVEANYLELGEDCITPPNEGEGCSDLYRQWWKEEVVPARRASNGLMIGGVALVLAGAGFLVYYSLAPAESQTSFAPVVTPDGIGAAFNLRF